MKITKIKRESFVYWCHSLLWLGYIWVTFKQKYGAGNFYTTPQEKRENNRIIKQAIHYNKHIVKPDGTCRSVVLAGRRF